MPAPKLSSKPARRCYCLSKGKDTRTDGRTLDRPRTTAADCLACVAYPSGELADHAVPGTVSHLRAVFSVSNWLDDVVEVDPARHSLQQVGYETFELAHVGARLQTQIRRRL